MTNKYTAIEKLAKLAYIDINPDEYEHYQREFEQILGLFEQLQQVDTAKVDPRSNPQLDNPGHQSIPRRVDAVTETDQHQQLQQHAIVENGVYLVPKVIE